MRAMRKSLNGIKYLILFKVQNMKDTNFLGLKFLQNILLQGLLPRCKGTAIQGLLAL
jgi:hypothetical protein